MRVSNLKLNSIVDQNTCTNHGVAVVNYSVMAVQIGTLCLHTYMHHAWIFCSYLNISLSMNFLPHNITQTNKCWEQARVYKVRLLALDYLYIAVESTHFLIRRSFGRPCVCIGLHTNTHTILCATCMSDHPPVAKLYIMNATHTIGLSLYCMMSASWRG